MPLPITIIGGYLGAGKTTLVNHLLRHANGRRLAVMVNEFGALPIDEDLIEAEDDQIISLAGGCVCCSYGEDLVSSMAMLATLRPRPDMVLLEASGVSFPGAIAGTVGLVPTYKLDGVVVLADGETIRAQAADKYIGGTIRGQLAQADMVLLNKTDLIEDDDIVRRWLNGTSGEARIVRSMYARVPFDVVFGTIWRDGKHGVEVADRYHADGYETLAFVTAPGVRPDQAVTVCADATTGLLRAKGFVPRPEGGLAQIQVVGRRGEIADAPAGAEPGVVCIGLADQINRAALAVLADDRNSITERQAS
ncbi:MAG: GTP-binding protein [Rhodospirillaceae bacterium]|nr:GTP-binding protein [Rhodospirillaceae bacterium]